MEPFQPPRKKNLTTTIESILILALPLSNTNWIEQKSILFHAKQVLGDTIMETVDDRKPTNDQIVAALSRLVAHLKKQHDKANTSAPLLSHYRELPNDVKVAYDLLHKGASMVHATSTKYTLVGKISIEDQRILAADLLRGCELIGAATQSLLEDSSGCSRSVRQTVLKASLAICVNVIHLAESFQDQTALEENIGAQKTGAVWESCNTILNKLLPQGNRNAIRRDLFSWTKECQDTMEEFQEMIDLGPADTGGEDNVEEEDDDFFGDEDQYSEAELPIAKECFALLKCSRGTMKITLEASEELGRRATESNDDKFFILLGQLYDYSREVGEGVTDFGSLLYPPLLPSTKDLEAQLRKQATAIITLQDFLLGIDSFPAKVTTLANTLRNAATTRQKDALAAIVAAKN
eukprot:scaffold1580_cov116-Cylindrotheca_fusiformis.AAC.13